MLVKRRIDSIPREIATITEYNIICSEEIRSWLEAHVPPALPSIIWMSTTTNPVRIIHFGLVKCAKIPGTIESIESPIM